MSYFFKIAQKLAILPIPIPRFPVPCFKDSRRDTAPLKHLSNLPPVAADTMAAACAKQNETRKF